MPKSRLESKLRPLISIFIESGMLTFFSQLTWVVLFQLQDTGFNSIAGPGTMIYGITPTLVLVRVAMGRSYEGKATTVVHSSMPFAHSSNHYELAAVNAAHGVKAHMVDILQLLYIMHSPNLRVGRRDS
ncbi:hypothetical protein BJ912DRAFT_935017 [Pholiota molesta]|nr:hypothetical protein BJ912DRAFT_935017 [Pholiota molesta]